MSDVTRNGVFLARALGDKSLCELLSLASGGSARLACANLCNPTRLMAGASRSLSLGRVAKQASSRGRMLFFRAVRGYTESKPQKSEGVIVHETFFEREPSRVSSLGSGSFEQDSLV
jgi:hypothetical protein